MILRDALTLWMAIVVAIVHRKHDYARFYPTDDMLFGMGR